MSTRWGKLASPCGPGYIAVDIRHGSAPSRMDQSSKIVAINDDPAAPIFQIAHYRIVGDLKEVIPMMIRAYRDCAR
jgi:hypothetical protein